MRINFLASVGSRPGGMNRVMLEYARCFKDKGHTVTILSAIDRGALYGSRWIRLGKQCGVWLRKQLLLLFYRGLKEFKCKWLPVRVKICRIPDYSERYLSESDITLTSSPRIVKQLASYSSSKGKKVYLIQGIPSREEVLWFNHIDSIKKIVVSSWLKNFLEKEVKDEKIEVVLNGVNHQYFYNHSKKDWQGGRIGMVYYYRAPGKIEDGIKAFEIVRKFHPEVQLVMFGQKRGKDVPSYVEFYKNPSQERIRQIYSSCDIFLYPQNRMEAFALPPLEAMACKCGVVTTDVGAISEYNISGKTALISPPGNPQALANNLLHLIEDKQLLKQISLEGYRRSLEFSWEKSASKLEAIFNQALEN